jgi:hypothetical protein
VLIFGSRVPGYQAPADIVDPAVRVPLLVLAILTDAVGSGGFSRPITARSLAPYTPT